MLLTSCLLLSLSTVILSQETSTLRYQEGVIDPTKPADPSLIQFNLNGQNYRPGPNPTGHPGPSAAPPSPASPTPLVTVNLDDGKSLNVTAEGALGLYDSLARGRALQNSYQRDDGQTASLYQPNPVNPGFIGPLAPQPSPSTVIQTVYAPPEVIPMIVDVDWLNDQLLRRRKIRVLDVTPNQNPGRPQMDYKLFRDQYYGKWDRLFSEKANVEFQRVHIPNSVHFNVEIATYPAWNDPSALYPPELFQEYVQRLGINQGDHLVIYSRGSLGGTLESARVWNMFRIYGHAQVSVLDGGLERWLAGNYTVSDVDAQIDLGNWTASFLPSLVISYDELAYPESDGYCLLHRLYWYNFLDARTKPEFYGLEGPAPAFNAPESSPQRQTHRFGSKSIPAEDLVKPDGKIYSPNELSIRLRQSGYVPGRESIAAGNTPEEASMVVLALAMTYDPKVRLYNAGIPELRVRSPRLIN